MCKEYPLLPDKYSLRNYKTFCIINEYLNLFFFLKAAF